MASGGTIDRVNALLDRQRVEEAARLLFEAVRDGEAAAALELARWRIFGNLIRRDLPAARALLARAAASGEEEAALLHANLLAAGVGGGADWAGAVMALRQLENRSARSAAQLALLSEMALAEDGTPSAAPGRGLLSEAPRVTICEALLSPKECAYLRALGAPLLQPSVIVDPQTGKMVPHPVRTSDGAAFGVLSEDLVVNAVNRRIAAFSGTAYTQGEPLQMLSYRPGTEYRPHLDAIGKEANQRILTVIVYLSDSFEGGETLFPRTGFSIRGKMGDAIMFRNVLADGQPDPMSLHAGTPVTQGTKVIATRWIRRLPFSYPPPQPLLAL